MFSLRAPARCHRNVQSLINLSSARIGLRYSSSTTRKSRSRQRQPQAVVQGNPPKNEPSWHNPYEKYEKCDAAFKPLSGAFGPSDVLKWDSRITYAPRWQFLERKKARFTHVFHDMEKAAHQSNYVHRAWENIYGRYSIWHYPALIHGQVRGGVWTPSWIKDKSQLGGWKKGMSLEETVNRALDRLHENDDSGLETQVMNRMERFQFMRSEIDNSIAEWNFAILRRNMLYDKDTEFEKYSAAERLLSHQICRSLRWHFRFYELMQWFNLRAQLSLRGIFL